MLSDKPAEGTPMNYFSPILTLVPVDHGIPVPPPHSPYQRKYPLNLLAVGDSFFVAGKTRQQMASPIRYATCACRKFTSHRVIENGVRGLRVWRIA